MPALEAQHELTARLAAGQVVRAVRGDHDEVGPRLLGEAVEYAADPYDALQDAEALILCTEWNEYRRPDFERMGKLMKRRLIFDGRNIYGDELIRQFGFERHGVGVPPIGAASPAPGRVRR